MDVELNPIEPLTSTPRELEKGVLVDSGAAATVANGAKECPEFALEESPGSKVGQHFVGPGKDRLPNRGQRKARLRLCTPTGPVAGLQFQDAEVRRPILSVGESIAAGNLIAFDQEESVILPKGCPEIEEIRAIIRRAKHKMPMEKDKNTFRLRAWVEAPEPEMKKNQKTQAPPAPFRRQGRM